MTKAEIKIIIEGRTSPFMTLANLTEVSDDSIAEGIILAGGTVADYASGPTDAECAGVTDDVKLLLAIEYSWLEYIIDNLPFNDITAGDISEKLSQLVEQLERKLERIKKKLGTMYGIGLATLTPKIINLNFQETYLDA